MVLVEDVHAENHVLRGHGHGDMGAGEQRGAFQVRDGMFAAGDMLVHMKYEQIDGFRSIVCVFVMFQHIKRDERPAPPTFEHSIKKQGRTQTSILSRFVTT